MANTSRTTDAGHTTLAATPARQGRLGKHMFWVLVFGVLLAAIGLFLAWTWKAPALSRADDKLANTRAAASAAYDAPNPTTATQQKP
ncbi:MAG TPA: hypothetical protein VFE10_15365 [Phenylobacterium sp.]|jgi:hypothetical protein|nr:hypothetical protein [Phenylobacterium sp.]